MFRNGFAAVALLAAASPALAADLPPGPPPGATTCSGCHSPAFMPINGHDAAGLTLAMAAFRAGDRPSTLMGRLTKGFSPDEIEAISAWIAAQK
jgi:cytochrome c553